MLVDQNCCALLTEEDAAVIVAAVLLHDSAMHMSEEGFLARFSDPISRPDFHN